MNTVTLSPKFQVILAQAIRKALHLAVGAKLRLLHDANRIAFILRKLHCSFFQSARLIDSSVVGTLLVVFLAVISPISALAASPQAAPARETIVLNGHDITLGDVVKIAENRADIRISPEAVERIKAARQVVQQFVDKKIPAYGVNTMYGQDVDVVLSQDQIERWNRVNVFQEATVLGDGSRPFLKSGVVRATMALLVNSYAKGSSGVSLPLVETLMARVNGNRLPKNIEDGGSVGDADLTMNNKLTVSLYDTPGFALGAGEATALMTHSFISIARAAVVAKRFEALLAKSKVALALNMEGFRANPSPVSRSAMENATTANKRVVQSEMQFLLSGSKLWGKTGDKGGPRNLQDFLSMRVAPDVLAAVKTSLERLNGTLLAFCNSVPVSPMVDVKTGTMLSVTEWDPTQLTLDVDQARQAMGMLAIAVESRGLKAMSRPFTDLPSGFANNDPTKYDGLYTRNISYWLTSLLREALENTAPVTGMTASFTAEGHEDISAAFPNSVAMAEIAMERLEKMVTLEALIGSFAIERRRQSGELTETDIPLPLRPVQKEIMRFSPMYTAVESQYSLAPLLKYFIGEYQPPKELFGSSTNPR